MDFVNREKELSKISNCFNSNKPDFMVIYGRRRVGKSELIKKAIEDRKDSVYFQATESTPQVQLSNFIDSVSKSFPEAENLKDDWEVLLNHLAEKDATVVIDEFPFLVEGDDSLSSVFQRFWDQQDSSMNLVLIGSSISVMEDKVLSGSSPLYGRWTEKIDLKPLNFDDAEIFFQSFEPEERFEMWSIFGGTPQYLEFIDQKKTFEENVSDLLLDEDGRFREEPEFLLRMELSKPQRYMSILKAIASGNTKRNEIAQATGIENSSIGTYLSKLERLQFVKRKIPVTEEAPRSRRGLYKISEPLTRFWFRFIFGNEDSIALNDNPFEDIVKPEINHFASESFEELCIQKLPELLDREYRKIGGWWHQEHEIDVVGLKDNGKILGECKYTESKVGKTLLDKLKDKEEELRVEGSTEYVLFSKSGFTQELEEHSETREDVFLFELNDMID